MNAAQHSYTWAHVQLCTLLFWVNSSGINKMDEKIAFHPIYLVNWWSWDLYNSKYSINCYICIGCYNSCVAALNCCALLAEVGCSPLEHNAWTTHMRNFDIRPQLCLYLEHSNRITWHLFQIKTFLVAIGLWWARSPSQFMINMYKV